jgi:toxin ParE1/3/4
MSRQVIIRPEAEADLAEAFTWYEEQRPGLGQDLLLSVEAGLAMIAENPQAFPVVHKTVRRALIQRFPYGVFYVVEEFDIVVLAVFHARRNPGRWKARS